MGHPDRRGVVALRAQRPPPPVHEHRRQGPGHPLRADPVDRGHAVQRGPPQQPAQRRGADGALRHRHQPAVHGRRRRDARQRPAGGVRLRRGRLAGVAARGVGEGVAQVPPLLRQELRAVPGAGGADVLEGAARQRARGAHARPVLGRDDLRRPRRRGGGGVSGRHARSQPGRVVQDAGRVGAELRGAAADLDPVRRAGPADRAPPVPQAAAQSPARDRARGARGVRALRREVPDGHLAQPAAQGVRVHQEAVEAGGSCARVWATPPHPVPLPLRGRGSSS